VAESIVDTLRPSRERYAQLVADPAELAAVRRNGAERARDRAAATVHRAKHAIGLLTD
jgi:tryptophanyl-tRNA synthetase